MKTNLDELFSNDKEAEKNGVWLPLTDTIEFQVKRFGGANSTCLKKSLAKNYKPFAKLIEKGLLPEEKERDIYVKTFVDACLLDWKGIEIDGEAKAYDRDIAIELFKKHADLFDVIVEQSQSGDNFKEDLGN